MAEAIMLGDSVSGLFLFPKEQIVVTVDGWKQTTDVERDVKFTTGVRRQGDASQFLTR